MLGEVIERTSYNFPLLEENDDDEGNDSNSPKKIVSQNEKISK